MITASMQADKVFSCILIAIVIYLNFVLFLILLRFVFNKNNLQPKKILENFGSKVLKMFLVMLSLKLVSFDLQLLFISS